MFNSLVLSPRKVAHYPNQNQAVQSMADSKAQQLTSSVDLARIDSNIKEQQASKAYAIR
jgi:hypothetical protein